MTTPLHPSKPSRWFARSDRMLILVLGVIACCFFAYRLGQLVSDWQHPADAAALHRAATTDLASLSPTLPLAGLWSFDELDWTMRTEWTSKKELAAKFAELSSKQPVVADMELPDADTEFLTLAAVLGVRSTEREGRRIYNLSRPGIEAQWITRDVAGKTKNSGFAVAYPTVDDQWQLLEFTPKSREARSAAAHASHLLPLPPDARRDGGRFADDGRVLMEFVSLESTAERLVSDWNAAGWDVHESGLAEPGEFSYLAVRDGETIYAWSADPSSAMRQLMLVRTPAGADTGP